MAPIVKANKAAADKTLKCTLPQADITRSDEFGARVVAGYAAGNKDQSKALFVPGKPTIYDDPKQQAIGRLGELAFVRAVGLSDNCLNWSDTCDGSYDLKLGNLTIDVKSSDHPRATRLIWPVSKNHFLAEAADIFVFVKVQRGVDTVEAEICGWVGRDRFIQQAKTSDGKNKMVAGTRYMDADDLNDMADLRTIIARLI